MTITSIRFNSVQMKLSDFSLIKVTGLDRETFFQGQITNDLSLLSTNRGMLTGRLNRTGKLQSFFFIGKLQNFLFLLCPKELRDLIKADFSKFIVMEDVELENLETDLWIQFNPALNNVFDRENKTFDFNFYGLESRLTFEQDPDLSIIKENEIEEIRILNGWPKWKVDIDESFFINDSYLNEIAISYKKGCFLGQETAAKIENNRGSAYYPTLLKLRNDFNPNLNLKEFKGSDFVILERKEQKAGKLLYHISEYLQVSLFRDFRTIGRDLEFYLGEIKINATVVGLPLYKNNSREEIALELYHKGVESYQKNNLNEALLLMEKALVFDPSLADVYESIGVILGREEKYLEAISWMDKLLLANPQSVMAHTNKSLFLMKLGKIPEAEEEKSKAVVKSFAFFGEEAKLKKQLEKDRLKKEEDILRREKMFSQVLEIDPEDSIALYGMADIYISRNDSAKAIDNLKKVIITDSKYSTAYLLLGKAFEIENNFIEAKSIYNTGIQIASSRGDMMPANEMQSRLNRLSKF